MLPASGLDLQPGLAKGLKRSQLETMGWLSAPREGPGTPQGPQDPSPSSTLLLGGLQCGFLARMLESPFCFAAAA